MSTVIQPHRTGRHPLLAKLIDTVRKEELFAPRHHLLVAISGGPDSIALALLLSQLASSWNLALSAVHVNYRLRGAESDEDEAFVTTFCRERQIPLIIHRPTLAKQKGQSSLQARAREVRYDLFDDLAAELNADRVVIGHTANDQAETVLLWLLRGAGLTGLSGMPIVRDGRIVRPLLTATRSEVLAYLDRMGVSFRQDSSNATGRYRRNRIRKDLLPAMEAIAPNVVRILARQAGLLRDDDQYLDRLVQSVIPQVVRQKKEGLYDIDRQVFLELDRSLQRRLVREFLRSGDRARRAPSTRVVESFCRFVAKTRGGGALTVKQCRATREGGNLSVTMPGHRPDATPAEAGSEITVAVPSTVRWAGTPMQIQVQHMSRRAADCVARIEGRTIAWFDADRFSGPLRLRSWRVGDRFCPRGMKGRSKKVQDLFTDLKIGRAKRARIPILVCPDGILWVVGVRQDERFIVRDTTTRCLVVRVIEEAAVREGV